MDTGYLESGNSLKDMPIMLGSTSKGEYGPVQKDKLEFHCRSKCEATEACKAFTYKPSEVSFPPVRTCNRFVFGVEFCNWRDMLVVSCMCAMQAPHIPQLFAGCVLPQVCFQPCEGYRLQKQLLVFWYTASPYPTLCCFGVQIHTTPKRDEIFLQVIVLSPYS